MARDRERRRAALTLSRAHGRPRPRPRRELAPHPDSPVVELRNVSRTYGSEPPVRALRGVDLVVRRGDAIAIVGPSGSGKSTLLNIVGCLDRPTGGRYLIDGTDVASLERGRARRAARSRCSASSFRRSTCSRTAR